MSFKKKQNKKNLDEHGGPLLSVQQGFVGEPSEPEGAVVASVDRNGSKIVVWK